MSQYALMHKNDVCGSLVIDDETGSLRVYKDNGSGLSPLSLIHISEPTRH